jgi:hypothetical protein
MKKTNVKDFESTICSNDPFKSGLESVNSRHNFLSSRFRAVSGLIIAHNATGCTERAVSGEVTNGRLRCGEVTP